VRIWSGPSTRGRIRATPELDATNASNAHVARQWPEQDPERTEPEIRGFMVGDTGIEPVTPTVSRSRYRGTSRHEVALRDTEWQQ
jgi:hypothetical protein